MKKEPPNTLTAAQAQAFRDFMESWINENCVDPDGSVWGQRKIGARLGITQNEVGRFLRGKANPGLQRLLLLSSKMNTTIERLLGLPEK